MQTCVQCGSTKIENRELSLCGSCGAALRKAERRRVPERKPLKKVSDKRQNELDQYAILAKAFLLRKWCAVHGKPCIPTQVHHSQGRVGLNEQGIPLLLDVTKFVPVCPQAHDWITEHSKEAIEQGYSIKRIS